MVPVGDRDSVKKLLLPSPGREACNHCTCLERTKSCGRIGAKVGQSRQVQTLSFVHVCLGPFWSVDKISLEMCCFENIGLGQTSETAQTHLKSLAGPQCRAILQGLKRGDEMDLRPWFLLPALPPAGTQQEGGGACGGEVLSEVRHPGDSSDKLHLHSK